jgi:arylamine N-acetyltransferase
MLDFDAYLERIGLSASEPPTLHDVHRAHATSITFENLDPHRGIPVSLAEEDLERKLVRERRGGYCFEQNLLLASALQHLGLEVEPMLARVRVGGPPGTVRPRSHLVLRIDIETSNWWTSTNPQSPFVCGLIAAVHRPDGSREMISDRGGPLELRVQSPSGTHVSQPSRDAIPDLLAERFALSGFALGADGRVCSDPPERSCGKQTLIPR